MKDEHGKQRALDRLQDRAQTAISLKAHYANGTLSAAQVLVILDPGTVGPAVYGSTYDVRYNGMMAAGAIADVVAAYGATADDPRGQTIVRIMAERHAWSGGKATVARYIRTTVGLDAVLALAKPKKARAGKAKAKVAKADDDVSPSLMGVVGIQQIE